MSRTRLWILGLAGLLLPVALAMCAFLISSKVGASADSPAVIQRQNSQINDESTGSGNSGKGSKHSGRCSEPEHASDPSCAGTVTVSPQPAPTGDGGSGTSGKDGSGSDSSGKGSGSDSSGSGSGSDSSGSGSGSSGSGSGGHGKDD